MDEVTIQGPSTTGRKVWCTSLGNARYVSVVQGERAGKIYGLGNPRGPAPGSSAISSKSSDYGDLRLRLKIGEDKRYANMEVVLFPNPGTLVTSGAKLGMQCNPFTSIVINSHMDGASTWSRVRMHCDARAAGKCTQLPSLPLGLVAMRLIPCRRSRAHERMRLSAVGASTGTGSGTRWPSRTICTPMLPTE